MKQMALFSINAFRKKPALWLSICLLVLIAAACFLAPLVAPYSFRKQNLELGAVGPCRAHWFGTDRLGRDLFSRVLYGGRISFAVGGCSTIVACVIGVGYGLLAGYLGGAWDHVMMGIVDLFYSLPYIVWVILLLVFFGGGMTALLIGVGMVQWLNMARIIRGQVMALKNQPFIEASRALGQSTPKLVWKHLLPNLFSPILVCATLTLPQAILQEAFLSFLGVGIQAPATSWGSLISDGVITLEQYPWLLFFPCVCFSATIFLVNLVGESFKDIA